MNDKLGETPMPDKVSPDSLGFIPCKYGCGGMVHPNPSNPDAAQGERNHICLPRLDALRKELLASMEPASSLSGERERFEALIAELPPIVHQVCEDPWYSCPKSTEGCINEGAGKDCNCGADHDRKELIAFAEKVWQAARSHSQLSEAVKADTLLGVFCGGKIDSPGVADGPNGINWAGWQRVADYVNRRSHSQPDAPSADVERLRMALEAAAKESFAVKNGLMAMRDSTELSPQEHEWIAAKIAQWMTQPTLDGRGDAAEQPKKSEPRLSPHHTDCSNPAWHNGDQCHDKDGKWLNQRKPDPSDPARKLAEALRKMLDTLYGMDRECAHCGAIGAEEHADECFIGNARAALAAYSSSVEGKDGQ